MGTGPSLRSRYLETVPATDHYRYDGSDIGLGYCVATLGLPSRPIENGEAFFFDDEEPWVDEYWQVIAVRAGVLDL